MQLMLLVSELTGWLQLAEKDEDGLATRAVYIFQTNMIA